MDRKDKTLVQAWFDKSEVETLDILAEKFSCSRAAILKIIVKNMNIDFNINLTLNKKE
jgi:hypothetical protein